ncbi:MAG TPA: M1 family peptidase, partial [Chryseosolibacter sp.]
MRILVKFIAVIILVFLTASSFAQEQSKWEGKFEQLDALLPTPNAYRTGSGAPGSSYWQQRADYVIDVELNDKTQQITGYETITYYNNAPQTLRFLWLQLDQNIFAPDNLTSRTQTGAIVDSL